MTSAPRHRCFPPQTIALAPAQQRTALSRTVNVDLLALQDSKTSLMLVVDIIRLIRCDQLELSD